MCSKFVHVCVCLVRVRQSIDIKTDRQHIFFFFIVTFTAPSVHQGRDLLLAQLTQPNSIPGWVEVDWPLSTTSNKTRGKRLQNSAELRIKTLALCINALHRAINHYSDGRCHTDTHIHICTY